jgi:hypothetical protein
MGIEIVFEVYRTYFWGGCCPPPKPPQHALADTRPTDTPRSSMGNQKHFTMGNQKHSFEAFD